MGACGVNTSYPGKTLEQAQKLFRSDQNQALWESGHNGYSGTIGELSRFTVSQVIFDTEEDFYEAYTRMDKNHGLWGQVRVVRMTKPLEAANKRMRDANVILWAAKRDKLAPSVIRGYQKRVDRLKARYDAIYRAQAQKSNKTTWHVGGWASS